MGGGTVKFAKHFPSFPEVKKTLGLSGFDEGHSTLTLSRHGLVRLLGSLARTLEFDESLYLELYPDVAQALGRGEIESAFQHFVEFGYFEGRFPGFGDFDANEYIDANPDIGDFRSAPDPEQAAREHYMRIGFREGRRRIAGGG